MSSAAKYVVKIFDPTRTTMRMVFDSSRILAAPLVTREVNKVASDVAIDLGLSWNDANYGQANGINPFDLVEVYAVTDFNPQGYLVFTGNVIEEKAVVSGTSNHVTLRVFPVDFGFSTALVYENLPGYQDISHWVNGIVDTVNNTYPSQMTKNLTAGAGIDNPTWINIACVDALAAEMALANDTFYWRLRPNLQFDLSQYNDAAPDHTLVWGRDIDAMNLNQSILDVVNQVIVFYASSATYTNDASIAKYGARTQFIDLGSGADKSLADAAAAKVLDASGTLFQKMQLTLNTNYPIETILPGDTVKIENLTPSEATWLTGVLRVVRTKYDGETCVVDLSLIYDNFGVEMSKLIGG